MADFTFEVPSPEGMREVAGRMAPLLRAGDLVRLWGELGAGKTTLVRALLGELGWEGPVRSPTFNLMQVYPTEPPVVHVDLYRVQSEAGLGLHEYLETHTVVVEWPDRLLELDGYQPSWDVRIGFRGNGREILINHPR